MKVISRFVLSSLLAASLPAAAIPAPEFRSVSLDLAVQFLTQPDSSDAQFDRFAQAEEIEGADFQAAVKSAIAAGRAIAEGGTPAKSKYFRRILADTLGVKGSPPVDKAVAADAPRKEPVAGAAKTKPAEVRPGDETEYAELQLDEKRLNTVLAGAVEEHNAATQDATQDAAQKRAAAKRDATQLALDENRARQDLLRSRKVEADAKSTLEKDPKNETAKLQADRATESVSVAETAVDSLGKKLAALETVPALTNAGPVSFVHGGVRLISPYRFRYDATAGKGYLDKAGSTDTVTFVEFVYSNRAAWSPLKLQNAQANGGRLSGRRTDFDFRLNYNLTSADSDANAIAGSGDFGAEVSLNLPFTGVRLHDPNQWQTGGWSVGPEISYGMTTDRSAFTAHQRVFFGAGYTMSYNLNGADTRWLLLQARLGAAEIDTVEFRSDTTHEVEVTRGDLPRYRFKPALAFETDLVYPLSRDSHLTFGGRVYAGPRPSSWTVYLGYTRSIADIAKALFPNFGEAETTGAPAGETKGAKPETPKPPANPSM